MKEIQEIYEGSAESLCGRLATLLDEGCHILLARFFCSDPARQCRRILSALPDALQGKVSVIGQRPLSGAECGLWVWWSDCRPAVNHRFLVNMTAAGADAEAQTAAVFRDLEDRLRRDGLRTADHCVRTWLFVRDIDHNYSGVVKGRKDWFDTIGLTAATHYIASTGIQGDSPEPGRLVQMDAWCIDGLKPGQVKYLQARSHLNPTSEYGVTFERGTSVTCGDRRHLIISGTASINLKGEVLYIGDPTRQTQRLLENMDMLLRDGGSGLKDVPAALVYLRDPADLAKVRAVFRTFCPWVRTIFLKAPVCRPAWLVEAECIASVPVRNA